MKENSLRSIWTTFTIQLTARCLKFLDMVFIAKFEIFTIADVIECLTLCFFFGLFVFTLDLKIEFFCVFNNGNENEAKQFNNFDVMVCR